MEVPKIMTAVTAAKYGTPESYGLSTIDTPKITKPDEILIKVYYASINPVDVKMVSGIAKAMIKETFPLKLGYDVSGTVAAIGTSVTKLKIGDEVFTRAPDRGSLGEYHISTEAVTSLKPASLSWAQAAAMPLVSLTSLTAIHMALEDLGLKDFTGKTVFVPAALSGTGSVALQLLKNVFNAETVITTASSGKIPRIPELLGEGVVDQIIDYTKSEVVNEIGHGKVDFFYDTMGAAVTYAPVMRKGGVIKSISTMVPSGRGIQKSGMASLPWYLFHILNFVDSIYRWRVGRYGAKYEYIFLNANTKDLDDLGRWVVEGKLKIVIGREADINDIEAVKSGCQEVYDAKGGVGKFIVKVAK